jgi:hypothetical protein
MAHRDVDAQWGEAWPPLEERMTDLLSASPVLVALLWQVPPRKGELPRQHLQRVVWERPDLVIGSLDPVCFKILQLASYHGTIDRAALISEAHDTELDQLDRRVRLLATLGLVTVHKGRLTVHQDLVAALPLPLPSFLGHLDTTTSDRLQNACRLLGVSGGTTKAARAAAIRSVLTDPERLLDAVRSAHPQAELVLRRIAERSVGVHEPSDEGPRGAVSLWDLDLDRELVMSRPGFGSRYRMTDAQHPSAFEALATRCLVGTIDYGYVTWMWLDAAIALRGAMFDTWAEPPAVAAHPIDEPTGVAARAVLAAEMLIDQLGADAPEGKKTGDRRPPVKAGRQAAKAVGGIEPALADLVVAAAIDLGLLVAVDLPARGRGRAREWPVSWIANRTRLDAWKSLPIAQRWLLLVRAWLFGPDLGHLPLAGEQIVRFSAMGDLASLEPGTGIRASEVSGWFSARHLVWPASSDDLIRDLTLLGVTSSGPTVGIGAIGRALLASAIAATEPGPELDALFAGDDESFVVQPDHTIITGSRAGPEVVRMLSLIAERESDGGAVVWRLSERALSRAARTLDADTVIGFLRQHSSVAISDNVVRFGHDHLRAGATAQIAEAASFLVCEDPATVSAAVAVKAAKLTALGPTAAVSTLAPAALRAALGAKGVSADIAGADATTTPGASDPIVSHHIYQPLADSVLRPGAPIPLGAQVIGSLVEHLTTNRANGQTNRANGRAKR